MQAPISLLTSSTPLSVTFLVLPSGPPMTETAARCFSTQAFQAAIPSRSLAPLSASGSAIHAFMRGLVLLPRKTARKVSFVLIGFPFVCTQGRSGRGESDDVQEICALFLASARDIDVIDACGHLVLPGFVIPRRGWEQSCSNIRRI